MGLDTIYCPKCGTGNSTGVRFCRHCGAELEAVAALVEGRLVVSEDSEKKGFFQRPSWEKAMIPFSFGVALLILGFILGFDPNTGVPTLWLSLIFIAFPLVGYGIAEIIKVSNKDKETPAITVRTASPPDAKGQKELPESKTEYVSPDAATPEREEVFAPGSVVEATTRHLEMETDVETNELDERET